MSMTRRDALKGGLAALAGALVPESAARAVARPAKYFSLHSFIEKNPKAVFIRRTNVANKMDAEAKRLEGLKLAQSIFVGRDDAGIPMTHRVLLKPNATSQISRTRTPEEIFGIGTDPQFYQGMVQGLQQLGVERFHMADSTSYADWNIRGLLDVNDSLGVITEEPERRMKHLREGWKTNWATVPNGVIYQRIPHYAPVGEPDTWLLNIAKWKAHSMGLTQTVKNEQGLVAHPYTNFCGGWKAVLGVPDDLKPDINPRAEELVNGFFERHRKLGYSRYDSKGSVGNGVRLAPIDQEIWAHKACDNMSTIKTGLAMVEGIYGRDGDGFNLGDDHLTNIVFFGKDKFRVDVIGLWLAGHEPGNVHLYRIAKERGLTDTFNPWEVPVYEWTDSGPVARKLTDFPRTPLKTVFLPKEGEPVLHMLDEPFDYDLHKA
jgi:uncharacterized protein (DUF362 family)